MKKVILATALVVALAGVAIATPNLQQGDDVLLVQGAGIEPVPAVITSVLSTDYCEVLMHFTYSDGAIAGLDAGNACIEGDK